MSQPKATSSARKPTAKRRRRLLRPLVLLVIITLGAYWLVLPGLVHRTILRKLSALGVTEAAFDLRHASWWRVHAANVQLGRPLWLRIGAVDAEYGLGGLLLGEPETVEITGAQWTVRVRDGAIDLGPVLVGQPDSRDAVELPFERLEIRSSTLSVEGLSRTLRLPVEGSVVRQEGGRWRADLKIGATALPIALHAAVNGSLPAGPADLEVRGRLTLEIAGYEIDARGALLTLATDAIDGSGPPSLKAELAVEELDVAGERVRDVKVVVRRAGDGLTYQGSAEGSGWRMSVLDGRASTARWEMTGHLPEAAADRLSNLGVDVEDLGRLTVTGWTSVHLPSSGESQPAAAGWRIELPDIRAQLEPGALLLRRPGIALRGLSGDLHLAGRIDPAGLALDLRPDSSMGAARIEGPDVHSGPVHAVLAPGGDRPFVSIGRGSRGVAADIFVEMSVAEPVSLGAGNADVTLGSLTLGGHVRVDGTGLVPDLRVAFANAGVLHRQRNLEAEGISGSLRFTGPVPLSTPGQQILVGHARLGKLEFTDGLLVFNLERPDSVLVERAEWRVAGGTRMRTIPFRFDPGAPVISTELYAENIALSQWLPLLTDDRATGDGVVYGRLAVTVRPSDPAELITLGEGFLYAAPGRGWISVRDASRLRTWLDASEVGTGQGAYQAQIKQRLVEALQDFEYAQLRVDLIDEGEEVLCRIATAGKGRRGDDPQEVEELVIRIHDFNGVLNDLLSLRSAVDHAADRGEDPPDEPANEGAEP